MTQRRFNWAYLIASLFLTGCGTLSARADPSRFFTLSSLQDSREASNKSATAESISLGIGPIKLPGYLDRQEIVTRSAENRFAVSENDRWAEPLDENFVRMLSQNLAVLLPAGRIIQYPWPSSKKPNYQVEVEVLRFEVNSSGDANLWARWEVVDDSRTPITMKESRLTRQAKDQTTDAAVAALSETGADFSREIADAVRGSVRETKLMSERMPTEK